MNLKELMDHLTNLNVDDLSLPEAEKLEQLLALKLAITGGRIRQLKSRK